MDEQPFKAGSLVYVKSNTYRGLATILRTKTYTYHNDFEHQVKCHDRDGSLFFRQTDMTLLEEPVYNFKPSDRYILNGADTKSIWIRGLDADSWTMVFVSNIDGAVTVHSSSCTDETIQNDIDAGNGRLI